MNGPDHYREAEKLVHAADGAPHPESAVLVAAAQVHALLALTAATVGAKGTLGSSDTVEWIRALGGKDLL